MAQRPLTAGETALAKTVFGDAIDTAAVKISDGKFLPFHPRGTGMSPNGNLYMYGCYREDYAAESTLARALFIHEMTHVWQYQNKVLNPVVEAVALSVKHRFNYNAAYPFVLDAKKDLLDYGMEQQASIVEEYFIAKHEGCPDYARQCRNHCSDDEKIDLYEKVLEKFLKNPAYARKKSFSAPRPPAA